MQTSDFGLLRIFTDEAALDGDRRLFEVVMARAKASSLKGVTVLRGRVGFGRGAHAHSERFLDHNYPLVLEIVDEEARLRTFSASLTDLTGLGLMTLEKVEILGGI